MESKLIENGATVGLKNATVAVVGSACTGDPRSDKAERVREIVDESNIVRQEWVDKSIEV